MQSSHKSARQSAGVGLSLIVTLGVAVVVTSSLLQPQVAKPSAVAAPRLVARPEALPGGGYRFTWTSVAGGQYVLQRWNGDDLALVRTPAWVDVTRVTATGGSTSGDDPTASGASMRFYRVVLETVAEPPPAGAPQVSVPTIDPPAALISHLAPVRFDMTATGSAAARIAFLDVLDGDRFLGRATATGDSSYRFVWMFDPAANGVHTIRAAATDEAGIVATSQPLSLTVALDSTAPAQQLGVVEVRAAAFQTNGNQVASRGEVRIGTLALSADAEIRIDSVAGTFEGRGSVGTPELGSMFSGDFTLDPETGWLSVGGASARPLGLTAGPSLKSIALNDRTTLTPSTLRINVLTREVRGTGRVEVLPDPPGVALELEGEFEYAPGTHSVSVVGALRLGTLRASGQGGVRLSDSLAHFRGMFQVPALAQASLLYRAGMPLPGGTLSGVNAAGESVSGEVTAEAGLALEATPDATPAWLRDNPHQFVALGPDGLPIPNARVRVGADGVLPPCEYRPAGQNAFGERHGLFLRFPNGARIVADVSSPELEFTRATAGFGSGSPLQFRTSAGKLLQRLSTTPARLPLGPLELRSLTSLSWHGIDATAGLPVAVFGIPLIWQGGAIADGGMVGARFSPTDTGFPLPAVIGGQPELVVDFSNATGLQIPVQGRFELGSDGPTITFPARAPGVLGFRADGSVFLRGQVVVEFPGNGGKIRGQLDLDPPRYNVLFDATALTLPMMGSLTQLLPAPACIVAAPAAAPLGAVELDVVAVCLQRYERALRKIHGTLAPFDVGNGSEALVPTGAEDVVGAVIEAWSQAKLASPGVVPPMPFADMFEQAGRNAAGAADLRSALAIRLALERARRAGLREGTAGAAFDQALESAGQSAVRLAETGETAGSFAAFREALELLLQIEQLRQEGGGGHGDARMREAMQSLMNRRLAELASALGVRVGEFRPLQNARLLGLGVFQAMDQLALLADALSAAQVLGLTAAADTAAAEALSQLAVHLQDLLEIGMSEAERAEDYPALTLALEDYLELARIQQSGILPATTPLRAFVSIADLASRLERVMVLDEQRYAGSRALRTQVAMARRHLAMVEDGLVLTAPSKAVLLAGFDRLTADLSRVLTGLSDAKAGVAQALLSLEAGVLAGRLRELLAGTRADGFAWESAANLGLVVGALQTHSLAVRSGVGLHQAAKLLQAEAEHHQKMGNPARRGYCLQQAQSLLETSRLVAGQVMAQINPATYLTELLLPGDLHVKNLAGALQFNTGTRHARADFSGALELPKFGLALTVPNATLQGDGTFDLTAYGSVVLPSASQPGARFTVPERHPLHVAGGPRTTPRFSGEGKLEINGLTLTAQLAFEDPNYAFSVTAAGMRFDLADQLRVHVPVLPDGRILDAAVTRDLSRSIRSLGAVYQALSGALEPPAGVAGRPSFQDPAGLVASSSLDALVDSLVANAGLGVTRDYANAAPAFQAELERLEQQSAESLETARTLLSYHRLARICEALERDNLVQSLKKKEVDAKELQDTLRRLFANVSTTMLGLLSRPQPYSTVEESELLYIASGLVLSTNSACFGKFQGDAPAGAYAAILDFHDRTRVQRFTALGLDPATARAVPGALTNLAYEEIQAGITNLALRLGLELRQNRESLAFYRQANQELSLELRSRCIAGLRRHYKREFALEDYQGIRLWSERLFRLTVAAEYGVFEYPANQELPNSDGNSSRYHPEVERRNWQDPYDAAFLQGIEQLERLSPPQLAQAVYYDVPLTSAPPRTVRTLVRSHLGLEALLGLKEPYGAYTHRREFQIGPPTRIYANPPTPAELTRIDADYARALARLGPTPGPAVQRATTLVLDANLARLRQNVLSGAGAASLATGLQDLDAMCRTLLIAERLQLSEALRAAREEIRSSVGRLMATAASRRAIAFATQVTDLLQHYGGILQDPGTVAALQSASQASLSASLSLLNDLKLALPVSRPVDLQLPGDLVIQRAHGAIRYNRETGELGAALGGRLAFPEVKAWFDVTEASFDTTGRFALKAGLASPTPFDGVRITARTTLSGQFRPNPNPLLPPLAGEQELVFSGSGTVRLPGGQVFSADLGYDSMAKTLSFTGTGANLNLTLGSQVAVFKAGAGVRFGGVDPGGNRVDATELRLLGSVGLFRNEKPAAHPDVPSLEDYEMVAENAGLSLLLTETNALLKLTNGSLRLPDYFSAGLCVTNATHASLFSLTNAAPGVTRMPARLTVHPANPIVAEMVIGPAVDVPAETEVKSVRFSGSIGLESIGVTPSFARGFGAEICRGVLEFPAVELKGDAVRIEHLPILRIHSGIVQIPLPPGETNHVEVTDFKWRLDGFPSGEAALAADLKLFDRGGFSFALLGGTNCPGQDVATRLRVIENPPDAAGRPTFPTIELRGGVGFKIDPTLLRKEADAASAVSPGEDSTQISGKACGSVVFEPNAQPQFTLDTLAVGGTFRLGASGIRLQNASLTFEGLPNAFAPSEDRPFRIGLNGTVYLPGGPGFGLRNSRFVFFDSQRAPRFEPGTLLYDQADWKLANVLPIQVTNAAITFRDGRLGFPALFDPANVKIAVSGRAAFPPQQPMISGSIQDLEVQFLPDGTPQVKVSSVSLALDPGLKIPPIEDIGGSLYVGGLDANPPNPFFVGKAGGSYQGYKLKLLFAFNLLGPVGLCLDVNAGPVGIPLDGGTVGFLLTGASGGMSFLNRFNDPSEFSAYMDPVTGRPVSSGASLPSGLPPVPVAAMDWNELRSFIERAVRLDELFGPGGASSALTTVVAPPAGRAASPAARFASFPGDRIIDPAEVFAPTSALDWESEEDGVQGTGTTVELMSEGPDIPCPGGCPPATVNLLCQPHPDQELYPGKIITKFTAIPTETLAALGITVEGIQSLMSRGANVAVETAHRLREQIDAGTPQPDAALLGAERARRIRAIQVEAFDAIESRFRDLLLERLATAGTAAGLHAAITNVAWAGLPCADVTFKLTGTFSHVAVSSVLSVTGGGTLSTTGSAGIAGQVNLFGLPVGKGSLYLSATDARGLPNPSLCGDIEVSLGPVSFGFMKAALKCDDCITGMLGVFTQCASSLAGGTLERLVQRVAPRLAGRTAVQLAGELTPAEKIAFFAELFQLPASSLPSNLPQILVDALGEAYDRIDPEFLFCGRVAPSLFGFPIIGDFGGAQMRVNKRGRDASFSFAPSQLLSAVISASFLPGFDTATFSVSQPFPDVGGMVLAGLSGGLSSPEAIAGVGARELESLLVNGTFTAGYEFHPLGMKLARVQSRIINPDLVNHPVLRGAGWKHPEDLGRGLPSRGELLQAAVRANLLGNALWKGSAEDLAMAYPDPASRDLSNNVRGLSLVHDYFPHGGVVGAGFLDVPRALYDGVPPELINRVLNPDEGALARLEAVISIVSDYALKTVQAGNLSFYMPAPNPPVFRKPDGVTPLSAAELLRGIMSFDAKLLAGGRGTPLYSIEESFMGGHLDGRFLGVPLAAARLTYVPAGTTAEPFFQVTAGLAPGSWLSEFVDEASLLFDIRQSPTNTVEATFTALLAQLQTLRDSRPVDLVAIDAQVGRALDALFRGLPKAKLEARLERFRMPRELQPLLNVTGDETSVSLFVYSPRFEPGHAGSGPVADVRRKGGMAFRGRFRVADLVTLDNAEFGVIPQNPPNGLPPVMAGRFQVSELNLPGPGNMQMRNVGIEVNTGPAPGEPAVRMAGELSPIRIQPLLEIEPNSPATMLSGRIELMRSAPLGGRASLRLSPARLRMPLFAPGASIWIDGGTDNAEFNISTDPTVPWHARVRFENGLSLSAGGLEVLRYGATRITGTITNYGTGSGSITLQLDGSQDITLFGSDPMFKRVIRLGGQSASLAIHSDGTFRLAGKLDRALDFTSIPGVGFQLAAGADFVFTQSSFSFDLNGSTFGPYPGASAEGSLGLTYGLDASSTPARLKIAANLTGSLVLDPILIPALDPVIQIRPVAAGATRLSARFDNGRFLVSGAKVTLSKPVELEAQLDPFEIDLNGKFAFEKSLAAYRVGPIEIPSGRLAVRNDPRLEIGVRGSLPELNLGVFRVTSRTPGQPIDIEASLAQAADGALHSGLFIGPARLAPPGSILSVQSTTFDIDGGLDAAGRPLPFAFSTDPAVEWSAVVRYAEALRLAVADKVLIETAGLSTTAAFKGRGLTSGSITFEFTPNSSFTVLPADAALRRTLVVDAQAGPARLTIGPGASFSASGHVGGFDLPGLFRVPAGSFVVASSPPGVRVQSSSPGVDLLGFGLLPATSGGTLDLTLDASLVDGTASAALTISPALLRLPSLLPSSPLRIHGGTDANGRLLPLHFNTDPRSTFSARVSSDDPGDLDFSFGGTPVVRYSSSSIRELGLDRDSSGVVRFTLRSTAGTILKLMPDKPFATSITLDPASDSRLTVGSDGRFSASYSIPRLDLTPAPFTLVHQSGGSLTLSLDNGGLVVPATQLLSPGLLPTPLKLPGLTLPFDSLFSVDVLSDPSPTLTVVGFSIQAPGVKLERTATGLWQLRVNSGSTRLPWEPADRPQSGISGTVRGLTDFTLTASLHPLVLPPFTLESTEPNGQFRATLGSGGLRLDTGNARLKFVDSTLCTFSLADLVATAGGKGFLLPANGDFTFDVRSQPFALAGYDLGSSSFTFRQLNRVPSLSLSATAFNLPGNLLGGVSLSGVINADQTFTLRSGANLTFNTFSGFPVNGLGSAQVTLSRTLVNNTYATRLSASGTLSGGVLAAGVLPGGTTTIANTALTLGPSGIESISADVNVPAIDAGIFHLRPAAPATQIGAKLDNNGLTLNAPRLTVDGLFTAVPPAGVIRLGANGDFSASFAPENLSIAGVPWSGIGFTLARANGVWSLDGFRGNRSVPGFGGAFNISNWRISSLADFSFGTSLPALDLGPFHIRNISAKIDAAKGLRVAGGQLSIDNLVPTAIGLPDIPLNPLDATGNFNLGVSAKTLPLFGFNFEAPSFNLVRSGNTLSIAGMNLTLPKIFGFATGPVRFGNGTISSGGLFNIQGSKLPSLPLGTFSLESMNASLTASGLTITGGELVNGKLFNRRIPLGSIQVPASVASDNFGIEVSPGDLAVLGYPLKAVSFSLLRSGDSVSLDNFAGDLGIGVLVTQFTEFGLRPDGTFGNITVKTPFRIAGAIDGLGNVAFRKSLVVNPLATQPKLVIGGMPIDGGGNVRLNNQEGLKITASLGVKNLGFGLDLDGGVTPGGAYSLVFNSTSPFFGLPVSSGTYTLSGAGTGAASLTADIKAGFSGTHNNLNVLTLHGALGTDGSCVLDAGSPGSFSVGGFGMSNFNLRFRHLANSSLGGSLTASGTFMIGGNGYPFNGGFSISGSAANSSFNFGPANLTLGGFTASDGRLSLTNTTMRASGSFRVGTATDVFNASVAFAGTIAGPTSYTLTGNAGFKFGPFEAQSGPVVLTSGGVAPNNNAPLLPFGGLLFPLTFRIDSGGVASLSGTSTRNVDWTPFAGAFGVSVWVKLDASAALSAAANGAVSGRIRGTFYWVVGTIKPSATIKNQQFTFDVEFPATGVFSIVPPNPIEGLKVFQFRP